MKGFKTINNLKIVDRMNTFIREITFFDDYTIFVDKDWLLKNNLLLFPLCLYYDEGNILELFNKANKNKNFYVSGIDFNRETHRNLKPIENVTEIFLLPDYIYEVNSSDFDLDFMQPPEYFLVINKDFNLGIIYDSDLSEYYIFGKKEDIEAIFGNLDDFIRDNQIGKKKMFHNTKHMKYYQKIYHYYEDILIKKGYLKDNVIRAEKRLAELMAKVETIDDSKIISEFESFVLKSTFEKEHTLLLKKEWLVENEIFAFPLFIKPKKNLLKFFNIYNRYQDFNIIGFNNSYFYNEKVKEIKKYKPSIEFIYEKVDFLFYTDMIPSSHHLIINSDLNFGFIYEALDKKYYIFGKKEKIETIFGNLDDFIRKNQFEQKKFINSLDYKFNYQKIYCYYKSILIEQGRLPNYSQKRIKNLP